MIAAAFAVAFAVLISSAEAAIQTSSNADDGTVSFTTVTGDDVDAKNGDTRYIQHDADGYVQFDITTTGSASASFTHSDATDNGQSIVCSDAADTAMWNDCDADPSGGGVTVALKIDDDSGKGVIFVKQTRLTGSGGDEVGHDLRRSTVTVAQVPTGLSAKAVAKSDQSGQG